VRGGDFRFLFFLSYCSFLFFSFLFFFPYLFCFAVRFSLARKTVRGILRAR